MGNTVRIRNGMENATEGDILGSASDIIKDLGVVDLAGGHLLVTQNSPLGMSVQVAGGVVYVPNSSYSILDSDTPKFYPVVCSNEVLTVDNNVSGSTRYDIVCVKIDKVIVPDPDASNVATKVVIKGTPGAGVPATPANHYKLAEIKVVNGETEITNAEITDKRGQVKCNSIFLPPNLILESPTLNNVVMNGNISGNAILDEDTMISNSNTKLATQQSIKTYINNREFAPEKAKLQIQTSTYDAFGILIKLDDDNCLYAVREGSSHVGSKGKIVGQKYNISTKTWGARFNIYVDGTYDCRNASGGIINGKIYIFLQRYDISGSVIHDLGYVVSNNLQGDSWSSFNVVPTGISHEQSPYGRIVATSTPGKYLQPVYGNNGSGTYYVKLLQTTNYGISWAIGDTIYSGSGSYTECSIANIGNGKMIALVRTNSGGYVQQFTSADDGETWSSPADTNLGPSTGVKIPHIIYDEKSDKVIALYCSRSSPYSVKISEANALDVYTSAIAWEKPITVSNMGLGAGYPSMVQIAGDKIFYVFANEQSSSDADIYGGIYEFMQTNPNIKFTHTAPIQDIKCSVLISGNLSVVSGVNTLIPFATKISDPSGSFDNSAGNYKFTAPIDGEYLVCGQLFWATQATDAMVRLMKNGILEILSMFPSARSCSFSKIVRMSQGDYLQVYCRQYNGTNLDLQGSSSAPHETYMTIHLLSRGT